jgi:hypothetical protein
MLPVAAPIAAKVIGLAIAGILAANGAAMTYHAGKGQAVVNHIGRELVKSGVKKIRIIDGIDKPKPKKQKPPKTGTDILADLFGQWVRYYK